MKQLLASGLGLCLFISTQAQVKLASIFTDNMVLQQQSEAPIWGWDKAGSTVTVNTSWNKKNYKAKVNANGKWLVKVSTPVYGGPYTVTISDGNTIKLNNVLIGEVWLCTGQSNMEIPMKGYKSQPISGSVDAILKSSNANIHIYTVPHSSVTEVQDNSKPSEWHVASPEFVSNFSATGYYFGRLLNEILHVPIGLISDCYAGSNAEAWMDADGLKDFPEIKIPAKTDSIKAVSRTPTTLFNGMLNPVIGYGIKGCIWYQGESNYDRPDQYEKLFPALVKRWRELWQQGVFPFYYMQIAPYDYAQLPPYNSGGKYNSAYLRDAQRQSLKTIPNSGMAVSLDVGEQTLIHPPRKEPIGTRLAYLALAQTYGIKGFDYASPLYKEMTVDGNRATIRFEHAENGLTSFNKPIQNFEIAGKDKMFYPAQAMISGSVIIVSSPLVKEPVAVRYAFKDFVVGDLFGTNGLPVSSFRTDDW
ncbi:sialate O-acetylesterase [Mucilaginibacter rubeus]|uniref:Sialate O-acetylesterase n=1 Tax=Mucilaginibacter rubeus TaxID=2027860 RepID=A0AAE6JGJ1_9SPHI|nr:MULTISPECIES: sialate O-acetylesterase [Mucilaginibacter]QEM05264.1 sialate O-acetylesterase [Mucilaginibacter rubeus]QEM17855.1 sialate O-acetylesterase [Mucilaginibacter gossypii]QTE45612.1 sialate O-acetylesterase [Mucilaginibacter rubeus]QTE52209.1 sialate O-acetylesterase [Mucilaginibacter rubeus]QTE57297.1 sialate O-acetylesterase [Mucilaginibacter rubeus]